MVASPLSTSARVRGALTLLSLSASGSSASAAVSASEGPLCLAGAVQFEQGQPFRQLPDRFSGRVCQLPPP
jgi:hypothetical protein